MSFLPNTHLILDSLGWAVLHSFWQGALAAMLVWMFRAITRESAADTRYLLGFTVLSTLFIAFIGTFLYYFNMSAGVATLGAGAADTINLTAAGTQIDNNASPLTQITNYTNWIGAFWALCTLALGTRYLAAFRLTHQLRRTGLSDLPSNWQTRFTVLAEKSGVNSKVLAYISDHVSSPITFGFFKPIVLVPAWFFTGMSPQQCEAVLLHELAHIRRHDYLTNIFQIIMKTVFFYHPAVQYICKSINEDREHACDDFAAHICKNPESLATALGTIRLKSARSSGVFALNADTPDAPLMHRLKRLVGAPSTNIRSGSSRGTAAAIMMGAACISILTLGATESFAHPHKQEADVLAGGVNSTNIILGGQHFKENITVNGKAYKATAFIFQNIDDGYSLINGKKYPSKYMYSVYTRNGKDYVVKQKNGRQYMEMGENWHRVGPTVRTPQTPSTPPSGKYTYGRHTVNGHSFKTKTNTEKNQTFIKVNHKWYDIDETDLDTLLPAPPMPPVAFSQKQSFEQRIDTEVQKAVEIALRAEGVDLTNTQKEKVWEQIERANEQRVRANESMERAAEQRERAEEKREAAFEQREAALERAQEQRERAQEQREAALERAEEQRERAMERAEEQREAAFEFAQEQRERAQEQRAEALERTAEKRERTRERIERQREKEHHKKEKQHKKVEIKYEQMRARLVPALTTDGYFPQKKKVTIEMTKDDIFINGKQLASAQEGKYCNIVSDYISRKGDKKRIVIKPGYFHVSVKGRNSSSNYTHTE